MTDTILGIVMLGGGMAGLGFLARGWFEHWHRPAGYWTPTYR